MFWESIGQTLIMVVITLVVGGSLGLLVGIALYVTRRGGLLADCWRTAGCPRCSTCW
ncbi:MAG: hypothetical protein WKF57_01150 [Nakamurella sp.]